MKHLLMIATSSGLLLLKAITTQQGGQKNAPSTPNAPTKTSTLGSLDRVNRLPNVARENRGCG